ncbi:sugar ABC transporter ATP-binding protein [Oceanibacterium hippocampi]|uniref:sugar ABC transporter ATP-binding protein n=1 Tax=Oceanibacterium hippocampi TaxID=745714 RepID=UPI001594C693|nr:sugar ABC transporter ATP-binding protein [Oceanibacterium hippocampi]
MSKKFGATQALDEASIQICSGGVHILLGENGAGKSTLAKIFAGVHRPDAGQIEVRGQAVEIGDARTARELGIGIVFQELSLAPHLSVLDNIFLGAEAKRRPFSFLSRGEEARRCRNVLEMLDLDVPLQAPVSSLPIAQKQLVEIAKVLARDAKIIIMDEPTSTLTDREKQALFRVIGVLKQRGVAILYVTHHLQEVELIGDFVSAMVNGRVTQSCPVTPALTELKLVSMLTGREVREFTRAKPRTPSSPLLTIAALKSKSGCKDVALTVGRGEIVGVYGVVGCGRESLGRVLVGLEAHSSGEIHMDGRPYRPRHPAHARGLGMSYLPMDRKQKGILPNRSIRENLNLMNLRDFSTIGGMLSRSRERERSTRVLDELLVRFDSQEKPITTLSGGNQQKVLFGRAIAGAPKVIVMEDPTVGIDIGAKADLYRLMHELRNRGISFLIFSSDLLETLKICDRIYSMYAGRIVREYADPTMNDEAQILSDILGQELHRAAIH